MKPLTLLQRSNAYLFLPRNEFIQVPCTQWVGNKHLLNEKKKLLTHLSRLPLQFFVLCLSAFSFPNSSL